ncbi:TDP-fucosamine acetyltransferase [Streptococcus varani]|uniref:TDP-fucosamine acetyltransferase n=1 Tax=Streptococcus varani TaxID=1608583 RepID=A0A0E4H7I9_9STRE|nr:GNAT family N-acetyltransferase [Streptococcus varani]CQR24522.1 TDP-fucosamine acetyltransferase [Streptococcus varani]
MSSNSFDYSYLDWDTDFFGVSSGRIVLNDRLTDEDKSLVKEFFSQNQFTVIYNEDNVAASNTWLGEETVASLTDVNVQFSKKALQFSTVLNEEVTISNQLTASEEILAIAEESFKYSRFFNDPYLDKEKSNKVYWNWVKSSFGKEEKYFVQYMLDGKCQGFILFSVHDSAIVIELIAVKKTTIQKGIGSQLLQSLETYAKDLSTIEEIKVGTQINNVEAVRFYTKNGYIYQSTSSVYHHWNKEE